MAPPDADGGAVAGTAVGFLSAQWTRGLQLDLDLLYNLSRRQLGAIRAIHTRKGHKHTSIVSGSSTGATWRTVIIPDVLNGLIRAI